MVQFRFMIKKLSAGKVPLRTMTAVKVPLLKLINLKLFQWRCTMARSKRLRLYRPGPRCLCKMCVCERETKGEIEIKQYVDVQPNTSRKKKTYCKRYM